MRNAAMEMGVRREWGGGGRREGGGGGGGGGWGGEQEVRKMDAQALKQGPSNVCPFTTGIQYQKLHWSPFTIVTVFWSQEWSDDDDRI